MALKLIETNVDLDVILKRGGEEENGVKNVFWLRHGELSSFFEKKQLTIIYYTAQGIHNEAYLTLGKRIWDEVECLKDEYTDSPLNLIGKQQCFALHKKLLVATEAIDIDLIIVSPMMRTLETAELALAQYWLKVPVIAVELTRERFGVHTCNKRSSLQDLRTRFPHVRFDLTTEQDSWHSPSVRETTEQVVARSKQFLAQLASTPHSRIAIVGHSDFMIQTFRQLGLTSVRPANCQLVQTKLVNI